VCYNARNTIYATGHREPDELDMPSQEEINQQKELLQAYRITLVHYLQQRAKLGEAYIPPGVSHGIRESRENIKRIKAILRGWNLDIEDHPDDEDEVLIQEAKINDLIQINESSAVFVGITERASLMHGERSYTDSVLNKPIVIHNWGEYTRYYGGFIEGAFLPHAVYGYFSNGGSRCYVLSVMTLTKNED
jgi:hypothetical protein